MLLLTSSSDLVRVNVASVANIQVHASYADNVSGTITPGRTNTANITGTGNTTVVAGPASGQRNVRLLSIRNAHAANTTVLTVEHSDGTNILTLMKVTLLAGELLTFDDFGQWKHHYADGGVYEAGVAGANPGIATRAMMEAATSTEYTVPPAYQHYHPGHPKCWCKNGVAGDIRGSYNMTSVTDTGAGLCAPQIGTDFSSVNWCCQVGIERDATALAVTNLKYCNIRSATLAAGSVTLESYDGTATTHVQEDPASWHFMGLGTLV